jgi:catechol 2,3-dioxygenase-like lactoylglutathione lyase family enzyme
MSQLIDHVSIAVRDLAAARVFYDACLTALGVDKVRDDEAAIGYGARNRAGDDAHSYLTIRCSDSMHADEARHWCLRAPDRATVDAFHAAGIASGGRDAGAPGLRPHYHPNYYAAFLLDPSGNKIEAVCHTAKEADGRR